MLVVYLPSAAVGSAMGGLTARLPVDPLIHRAIRCPIATVVGIVNYRIPCVDLYVGLHVDNWRVFDDDRVVTCLLCIRVRRPG